MELFMAETIKTPADSAVETRYLVMPGNANAFGTAFGGAIMGWIDMVAAMAAQKHCGRQVVTAGIDSVAFEAPVCIGDQVVLLAAVNYVSRTSMEVGVKVIKENPATGQRVTATRAFVTLVAIDENHHPFPVPQLTPQTDEEKRRANNAALRVKARKQLRQQTTR
jgi:acyl-CoA hydrolase